jgi:hypothetical protein
LEVQVLSEAGHRNRSEPQLREGDRPWEGSGERNRGPTNRNRIPGAAERGERALDREASMAKRSGVDPAAVRGRAAFLPGEISPRARKGDTERWSEKSAEAVVATDSRWRRAEREGR